MHTHNIHKHTTSTIISLLIILTFTSGVILTSPKVSADSSAGVTVTVTVPAVCSLTASSDSVSNTIYPGNSGLIGTSTIKAICNDPAGLAVYAIGYTNDTYGNNKLVNTVGGNNLEISSYVTPSGSTPSQSEWNMTINAVSGNYAPTIISTFEDTANVIPIIYTKVAYRNTMTDMGSNATGANFTASFNAYIANNQAAGTYTGKVKFLLVHPVASIAEPARICYYGNGEDEGTMDCQTKDDIDINYYSDGISPNADVQLRAPNFSRAGYGFTGWNTKEDGTGTQYGPNEVITFTQDMHNNGLALFANWKAAEVGVTMQTFDDTVSPYAAAPNGTVIALRDERDNDVYAIAKLPYYGNSGNTDGKWWMIENLRLDYNANITTLNTQSNNEEWGGVFAGLAQPETTNFSNSTTANTLYTTDTTSIDLRIITGSSQGYRFPRYNNNNTASRASNQTSANTNLYGYGNYYTWPAAVADTAIYTSGNRSVTKTSLCPTGWHLPTGGGKSIFTSSEWWMLTRAIVGADPANYDSSTTPYYTNNSNTEGADASKAMRRYPTNIIYSGYYGESSNYGRGHYGYYWSSTVSSSNYAYNEIVYDNTVNPSTSTMLKNSARTIRCVAD